MKKILFILLALVLAISLILVACQSAPATTTQPANTTTTAKPATTTAPASTSPAKTTTAAPSGDKYGGTWVEALSVSPARPIGYPPEAAPDSWSVASCCLEGLVSVQLDGSAVPVLATSWTVATDGLSITFNLRKGVKFHDGSDFNADVCKWNMDLNLAAKQMGTTGWKSIEKIDDYTIRVNFNSPGNTNLTGVAGGPSYQISKAYFDKNGLEATRWHPVGTGAFVFESYERDAKLVYKRNPNYWDAGKPYLDSVVMTIIQDSTVRKLSFQKGDINRFAAQAFDASELVKTGLYTMKSAPGGTYSLVPCSNVPTSPWSDIRVRFAASYALNRNDLAEGLGFGFLTPAYQLFAGFPVNRIDNLIPTSYNQAKAKDLLKEAGYPTGFKTTVHVMSRVVTDKYNTAVVEQLRGAGINADIDVPTSARFEELRYGGWKDGLLHMGLSNLSNPNQTFIFYFMSLMFPSVKKPAGFTDGVNASLATPEVDPAKVKLVTQLLYDDMTVIPYVEAISVSFYKKGSNDPSTEGYGVSWPRFEQCWIDKSAR
jgi:peptide/nickel transport system substrate-binding protein